MNAKEEFKALMAKAETIRKSAEAKGAWSEEDSKAYEGILGQADKVKLRIDLESKEVELKAWGQESEGSVFLSSRTAGPNEGNIEGVTGDNGSDNKSAKELFGYNHLGEAKVKALKSGAYKDAYNAYLRNSALYGNNWQSYMKGGAQGEAMKVLQEGQDTAGGFWVPIDQRAEVVSKMAGITGFKNDAYHFSTGSDLVKFPKVVYTSNPSDDSLSNIFTTGLRFSNGPENPSSDISEATNPAAGTIDIPIHLQTAAIIVTRQLMEDAGFDVMGFVAAKMGESMGLQEDYWSLIGTGSGQPQGVTVHANASVIYSNGGMYVITNSNGAVVWGSATQGLLGMDSQLPPQYDAKAKWYARKQTYAAIRAINLTTAGVQWSLGDSYPNAANGMSPSLLGYPVVKDQFVAALATDSLSMILGDASGYYMPERVGLSIEVFREVRGLRDQVVLYGRRRLGGQLVEDWKLKLLKAGTS